MAPIEAMIFCICHIKKLVVPIIFTATVKSSLLAVHVLSQFHCIDCVCVCVCARACMRKLTNVLNNIVTFNENIVVLCYLYVLSH
jgi:hypothetical protein